MTSITNTTDRAAEHVGEAASHAKRALLEISAQVGKAIQGARNAEERGVDALLDRLGLQRRESALRPLFWVATGAIAAGAMVALLMSTAPGKEMRRRIATFVGAKTDAIAAKGDTAEPKGEHGANSAAATDGVSHEAG